MSYTKEDVLEYWDSVKPSKKTRKREFVDMRNYIIALLHYKFKITETKLEEIIEIDRTSINHNKKFAYNFLKINEPKFLLNTTIVRSKFPYDFPKPEIYQAKQYPYSKLYSYKVNLDKKLYTAVQAYGQKTGLTSGMAIRSLVIKALEEWEE
jgi:hypothetical protein